MQLYDIMNMIKSNKKSIDNDINICTLKDTYLRFFINLAINVFQYENIPVGLDTKALETMLLSNNALIKKDDKNGILAIPYSYEYGVDLYSCLQYYQRFDYAGFANPVISDYNLEINKDCYIARDTESSLHMINLLEKSAIILAHIDISIMCVIINSRMQGFFSCDDDKTVKAVEKYYEKLKKGDYGVIQSDENVLYDRLKYVPFQTQHNTSLQELINAKNNEMRSTLRLLGISMSKDKSQAILSDEVDTDLTMYEFTIDARLQTRIDMCNWINSTYGENLICKINEKLNYKREVDINADLQKD